MSTVMIAEDDLMMVGIRRKDGRQGGSSTDKTSLLSEVDLDQCFSLSRRLSAKTSAARKCV